MKLYIVMAHDDCGHRWFDSFWVSAESASDRMMMLRKQMEACGRPVVHTSWWTWIVESIVEDAKLSKGADTPAGQHEATNAEASA